jgi:Raf kinase inhibitor-like YbhB/YbcL family protein
VAARRWTLWIAATLLALVLIVVAFVLVVRRRNADIAHGQTRALLHIASSSFVDGATLPQKLTCDGASISPEVQFPLPPTGAKSFAIVEDDPDAPLGYVHWIVYNIPISTREIPEGASRGNLPAGAAEGVDSMGAIGYAPPCPPGSRPHHYVLSVYALNASLDLPPGGTKKQLAAAVKGHVLAEGQLTGLYVRGSH